MLWDILVNPILFVIVGLSALYVFVIKQKKNLPPGPNGWPIVGNLLDLSPKTLLAHFRQLRKQYGDIYTVKMGSINIIVVNGYESLKEVFVKRGDEFSGRPDNFINVDLSKRSG